MALAESFRYVNRLVPVATGDEVGYGLARLYALANQTPLAVVLAVGEPGWCLLGHSDRAEAAFHEIGRHARGKSASISDRTSKEGIEVHTERLEGTPYIEVIRKTIRGGYDLVIRTMMGSAENANTANRAIARKLIRKAFQAVPLVHPAFKSVKRVVSRSDRTRRPTAFHRTSRSRAKRGRSFPAPGFRSCIRGASTANPL